MHPDVHCSVLWFLCRFCSVASWICPLDQRISLVDLGGLRCGSMGCAWVIHEKCTVWPQSGWWILNKNIYSWDCSLFKFVSACHKLNVSHNWAENEIVPGCLLPWEKEPWISSLQVHLTPTRLFWSLSACISEYFLEWLSLR